MTFRFYSFYPREVQSFGGQDADKGCVVDEEGEHEVWLQDKDPYPEMMAPVEGTNN